MERIDIEKQLAEWKQRREKAHATDQAGMEQKATDEIGKLERMLEESGKKQLAGFVTIKRQHRHAISRGEDHGHVFVGVPEDCPICWNSIIVGRA